MSTTKEMTARDAKNRFGELLSVAQRTPVHITKNGRNVAVLLSLEEYERYERSEDALWAARAEAAHDEDGYLGPAASDALLKDLLDVRD